MKILITGGSGFIGQHLVRALMIDGHDVLNIDKQPMPKNALNMLPRLEGVAGHYFERVFDIADGEQLDKAMVESKPDAMFHLAAMSRVQQCDMNKMEALASNVGGTFVVCYAAAEYKVPLLVVSSSAVYGDYCMTMTVDQTNLQPLGLYGKTKLEAEWIAMTFRKEANAPIQVIRPFNVFGPGSPTSGPYAPVVGRFLDQWKECQPLTVVGNGSQRRDFIHVQDLVDLMVLALLDDAFQEPIINGGSGTNYSIKQIADAIDPKGEDQVELPPRDEPEATLADMSNVYAFFNWRPTKDVLTYANHEARRHD